MQAKLESGESARLEWRRRRSRELHREGVPGIVARRADGETIGTRFRSGN
jgi:hypothetical protein